MHRLRALAAVSLTVAITAGCSGGGGGKETSGPAPLGPVTSTTAPTFTGAGSGRFCAGAGALDERFAGLLGSAEPDVTRTLFTSAQEAVSDLADSAPPEIKADLTVLVGAYRQLLDGLRRSDYDLARLPADVTSALQSPPVRTAGDRIDVFRRTVCGQGG